MSPRAARSRFESIDLFTHGEADTSLVDLVDNVLNHGVVLEGELLLAVADVDLVYARLALMLSAIDRVRKPPTPTKHPSRRPHRRRG